MVGSLDFELLQHGHDLRSFFASFCLLRDSFCFSFVRATVLGRSGRCRRCNGLLFLIFVDVEYDRVVSVYIFMMILVRPAFSFFLPLVLELLSDCSFPFARRACSFLSASSMSSFVGTIHSEVSLTKSPSRDTSMVSSPSTHEGSFRLMPIKLWISLHS